MFCKHIIIYFYTSQNQKKKKQECLANLGFFGHMSKHQTKHLCKNNITCNVFLALEYATLALDGRYNINNASGEP
jgi:hypothetical protein